MPNNLFSLFDERLKIQRDLVASEPQSLDSLSSNENEQELFLRRMHEFERVKPKVDYSDFSNFVFFNSALDYFNLTGEKILNEYPYDSPVDLVQQFRDDLDDYQLHILDDVWPRCSSKISFDPSVSSSFIQVDDLGSDGGSSKTNLLSPDTGSWTIELWCIPPPALTGSNDVMCAVQKVSGSTLDGYTVYFSGSTIVFRFASGSTSNELASQIVPGVPTYAACVLDRTYSPPLMTLMTGGLTTFPMVAGSSSFSVGSVRVGGTRLNMGSGSLLGKVVRPFTGSLDNVRLWAAPLGLMDVTSSFNAKIHAQKNLVALWRFNESGSSTSVPENSIVLDYSGHRLDGRIQGYFGRIRSSGSIIPYEQPDPILLFDAPEVQDLIMKQQTSGSFYDRMNQTLVTKLFPQQFFQLEEFRGTQVLQNFLYILARNFDSIKIRIDQFTKVLRQNYGSFDQTPDELLAEVGKFFGWEFTGNFLNANAFQYILGKQVLAHVQSNAELETTLFEIKNNFWKRTLLNLMHLYKTKGTRESVESLLRIYGVDGGSFVRLKEYGYRPRVAFGTHRVFAEKSVASLTFGSGSTTSTSRVISNVLSSSAYTIESRILLPTTGTREMPATILTGSIWSLNDPSGVRVHQLYYVRDSLSSITGSLFYTGSVGNLSLSSVPIFDGGWRNVVVTRDVLSGSVLIDVRSIDDGEVISRLSSSLICVPQSGSQSLRFWVGSTGSFASQHWGQEFRIWNQVLNSTELDDHALNFQSFGTDEISGIDDLVLHWRLNENVTASVAGDITWQIQDVSGRRMQGAGSGFIGSTNPYRKFLSEYNYIASPDQGWTEEKIRVLPGQSKVGQGDAFSDNHNVSLEFNMVDALNEDISQMIATMDSMNTALGLPANRYRSSYQDLHILRQNYFKRLQGRLNFRVFFDMLEFFDKSFVDMVRRLIPARSTFLGDELVVESHMLERPKHQWNYRRQEVPFEPLGVIKVYIRT